MPRKPILIVGAGAAGRWGPRAWCVVRGAAYLLRPDRYVACANPLARWEVLQARLERHQAVGSRPV